MEARRSLKTSVRMRETLVLLLSTKVESTGPLWRRAGDGGAGLPRNEAGTAVRAHQGPDPWGWTRMFVGIFFYPWQTASLCQRPLHRVSAEVSCWSQASESRGHCPHPVTSPWVLFVCRVRPFTCSPQARVCWKWATFGYQVCSEPLHAGVLGWRPQPCLSSCSAFCQSKQGLSVTRTQGACVTDSHWAVRERLTASFFHQPLRVTVVTNPSPTGAQSCLFATGAPSYHLYPEATEEGGQTLRTPPPSPRVRTLKRPPQGMCSARSVTPWDLGSVVIPHSSTSKHVTCLRFSFPPAGIHQWPGESLGQPLF